MPECSTALTPANPSRKGRSKVKTGCRTCKARKVKCDERFPACNRCISTGRVCDGYGIWGGGGNSYGERYAKSNSPPEQCSTTLLAPRVHRISTRPGLANSGERAYFDWFINQSSTKLPGIFGSGFWDTLVLQASATEPAILHAVLALSCAHRSSSIAGSTKTLPGSHGPDKHEQFCLRQYSSAIGGLKPHFMSNSKASIRVALIACIIFMALEFVRGQYQTGKSHFHNGLKLLAQLKAASRAQNDLDCSSLSKADQSIDGWLAEQFARLHLQARLFGQSHTIPRVHFSERNTVQPVSFVSTSHARRCLDRLIGDASALAERYQAQRVATANPWKLLPSPEILQQQSRIQYGLSAWYKAYEISVSRPSGPKRDVATTMGYNVLYSYYLVARITVSTCLRLDGEMAYDAFTNDFRTIMRNSFQLGEIVFTQAPGTPFEHNPAVPPIVADMGWITPLYFVAMKCRVRSVRTEAISFLAYGDCKEGIWDASIAAKVATEVMEMEEEGLDADADAPTFDAMKAEKSQEERKLPPETNRVFDVEVVLPEGSNSSLGLVCGVRRGRDEWDGRLAAGGLRAGHLQEEPEDSESGRRTTTFRLSIDIPECQTSPTIRRPPKSPLRKKNTRINGTLQRRRKSAGAGAQAKSRIDIAIEKRMAQRLMISAQFFPPGTVNSIIRTTMHAAPETTPLSTRLGTVSRDRRISTNHTCPISELKNLRFSLPLRNRTEQHSTKSNLILTTEGRLHTAQLSFVSIRSGNKIIREKVVLVTTTYV
ncbi:hypothetical protein Q7P37_009199 [Cladosporium fusiforme]